MIVSASRRTDLPAFYLSLIHISGWTGPKAPWPIEGRETISSVDDRADWGDCVPYPNGHIIRNSG